DAELVDLVEQEDRVAAPRLLDPREHAPRHRAHVGAPVPPDVGLVPGAPERDPHVPPPERPRDRLGDRRLPRPRRAGADRPRLRWTATKTEPGVELDTFPAAPGGAMAENPARHPWGRDFAWFRDASTWHSECSGGHHEQRPRAPSASPSSLDQVREAIRLR